MKQSTLGRVTATRLILIALLFFLLGTLEGLMHPTKFMFKNFYSALIGIDPQYLKTFFGYFVTKIHTHIALVGWLTTAMMGLLYYTVEQIKGGNRYCRSLCVANVLLQVVGVLVLVIGFHIIGVLAVPTGAAPGTPEFRAAGAGARGLVVIGGLTLLTSCLVFIFNIAWTLLAKEDKLKQITS
jgi:cbb3-type cytochrome oxidase subunit 1